MPIKRKLLPLVLAGAMTLPLAVSAQAADYADLSWDHWAYEEMDQAVKLGIITGVGDNKLAPTATLSWGQFLTMLARTFAGEDYEAALAAGQAWDLAGYTAAVEAGILRAEDGLPVAPDRLSDSITRKDAAVLLYRVMPEEMQERYAQGVAAGLGTFTDLRELDELHQAAVCALAGTFITNGKTDGSFGINDQIQRCDGTVLLMRTLSLVDDQLEGEPMTVTLRYVDETTGQSLLPDRQVEARVGQSLYELLGNADVTYYYEDYSARVATISSGCDTYVNYYYPMSPQEIQEEQFWQQYENGLVSADDYWKQDFWLTYQGENARKCLLLFGDENKRRFANRQEAEASMTTVTVPVWKLSNGAKVSSTLSLSIHSALAEDVKEIFTEIYNDPEQFPIYELGGYSWRGDTATGEHNCGTAIDINSNENYQVREGVAQAGSLWQPGVNAYSIGPDSSVVRIFEEHGWSWGGDAWAWDSDPTQGYHDYMHFSYMGM